MNDCNPYNVLIIFFNNYDRFVKVFDAVALAKPCNLFLYQDGPRHEKDLISIIKIREYIKRNIDWKCNVHTFFQQKNVGCDPSEYISQKWAFSIVDKCIVLEDDDVPSLSFFQYCWDLLIKYECDSRISIICGMNNLGIYPKESNYSYFFAKTGSIWGWASWRRFVDTWDEKYSWLDDKTKLNLIKKSFSSRIAYKKFISLALKRKNEKKAYYETILGAATILNKQVNIIPQKNLISNIGLTGGTHTFNNDSLIPKKILKIYNMETYNITFPLIHPDSFEINRKYDKLIKKKLKINILEKLIYKSKSFFNTLFR